MRGNQEPGAFYVAPSSSGAFDTSEQQRMHEEHDERLQYIERQFEASRKLKKEQEDKKRQQAEEAVEAAFNRMRKRAEAEEQLRAKVRKEKQQAEAAAQAGAHLKVVKRARRKIKESTRERNDLPSPAKIRQPLRERPTAANVQPFSKPSSICLQEGNWSKASSHMTCPTCFRSREFLVRCSGCSMRVCVRCEGNIRLLNKYENRSRGLEDV